GIRDDLVTGVQTCALPIFRTPLTILKGELEVALRRERPPEVYRDAMASMKQEVDRLVHLVEDLLILARADAGVLRLDLRPVAVEIGRASWRGGVGGWGGGV